MRTGLVISLALLMAVAVGGYLAQAEIGRITLAYVSAAEELRVMTEDGAWDRAAETLRSYQTRWEGDQARLKWFVKHTITQEITMAMERLQVGVAQQDTSLCALSCVELRQQARLLQDQETLSWPNLL